MRSYALFGANVCVSLEAHAMVAAADANCHVIVIVIVIRRCGSTSRTLKVNARLLHNIMTHARERRANFSPHIAAEVAKSSVRTRCCCLTRCGIANDVIYHRTNHKHNARLIWARELACLRVSVRVRV